jgi:hypothetical protein
MKEGCLSARRARPCCRVVSKHKKSCNYNPLLFKNSGESPGYKHEPMFFHWVSGWHTVKDCGAQTEITTGDGDGDAGCASGSADVRAS